MAELLILASLITAFIAGIAALFAPCCITVLLPAYLGSIFRQKRTVLLMTGVFFLGLLAIFLPLGLGFSSLGELLRNSHGIVFTIGGGFMLLLGLSILLGVHFTLPFNFHPSVKVKGGVSVFVLGIFSGIATLCCAPVLAGVFALSILPGSFFWGGMYALAYTLGMVVPLFIIAYFLDNSPSSGLFLFLKKETTYSLGERKIRINGADVLSGITFALMGLLILGLNATGKLNMGGGAFQTIVNIAVSNLTAFIMGGLGRNGPAWWIGIIAVVIFLSITIFLRREKGRKRKA